MIRTVLLSGPGVVAFLVVVFAGTIAVLRSLAIDEQAPHVGEDTRQRLVEARRREDFGETVDVPSGITEAQRRRGIGAKERERRRVESCCYAVGLYPYLADDCPWCGPPRDAA